MVSRRKQEPLDSEPTHWMITFGGWMPRKLSVKKRVVYLGIPFPLKGICSQVFLEPKLQKLHLVLNKITRAKLTHVNAVEVIARRILPGLCYPCPAARPNKLQPDSFRTNIFAAATNGQCQALDAHGQFKEITHALDPQCVVVFHNMRFWRNIYCSTKVDHLIRHGVPLTQPFHGPLTISQKDLD